MSEPVRQPQHAALPRHYGQRQAQAGADALLAWGIHVQGGPRSLSGWGRGRRILLRHL